jgi:hypothetical protein
MDDHHFDYTQKLKKTNTTSNVLKHYFFVWGGGCKVENLCTEMVGKVHPLMKYKKHVSKTPCNLDVFCGSHMQRTCNNKY